MGYWWDQSKAILDEARVLWDENKEDLNQSISVLTANVKETLSQIISFSKFIYRSPWVRQKGTDAVVQAVDGSIPPINKNVINHLIQGPETRSVLFQAISANTFYIGTALLYELVVTPALNNVVPGMENSIDKATKFYFFYPLAIVMIVNNVINNLSLAKVVMKEKKTKSESPFKKCEDANTAALIRASIESLGFDLGKGGATYLVSRLPPGMSHAAILALMLRYGQGTIEYPIAAAKNCTLHRNKIINQNNVYCLTLGAMLYGTYWLLNEATFYLSERLPWAKGINDEFRRYMINDGLFNIVCQFYIITALLIEKPLPGNEDGIDWFRWPRMITEDILQQLNAAIVNPSGFLNKIAASICVFPPVKLLKWLLLFCELRSLNNFIEKKETDTFIRLYEKDLRDAVKEIKEIREGKLYQGVNFANQYVPFLDKNTSGLLSFLLRENLDYILDEIKKIVAAKNLKSIEEEFDNMGVPLQEKEPEPLNDENFVPVDNKALTETEFEEIKTETPSSVDKKQILFDEGEEEPTQHLTALRRRK